MRNWKHIRRWAEIDRHHTSKNGR